MFELTYQCNFHCPHCYVPQSYKKKRELKTQEVFFVLDELKNIGCFYLGFTGGEVFLRKDILAILWYAKKKGFEIIIYTNGSLIDKMVAEELKRIRVNKVDITIPAMSPPAFERISGVPGSREKVFAAIHLLRENKVALGFKTCVLKENESEIQDIQNFAASLGALHRLDDTLSRRLDGSGEPFKYRGQIIENRRQGTEDREKKQIAHKIELSCNFQSGNREPCLAGRQAPTVNLFRCGVGISQAAITPQGELKPCLMLDYPRFKIFIKDRRQKTEDRGQRADIKAAWGQLKEFISAIKPDENYKCNNCELEMYCKWCPAKGWLYNKSFTPLEKADDKLKRQSAGTSKKSNFLMGFTPLEKAGGKLKLQPTGTFRKLNSLTGFTSCDPESRKRAGVIKQALV